MKKKMEEYQNSLEEMSSEAVEYVRGIPVVKTFGQSVFSFKRFQGAIKKYEKWVIAYTKDLRIPMMGYVVVINSIFAILIAAAYLFGGVNNYSRLTDAEKRITKHLYAGKKRREIAEAEFVSMETVKTHISHILKKLGFHSAAELTAFLKKIKIFDEFDV